jgi:hypothetical protein
MPVALGATYAWTVFRIPLPQTYGWTISGVTFALELAILVLGFASFGGALWMRKTGFDDAQVSGFLWVSGRAYERSQPFPRPLIS